MTGEGETKVHAELHGAGQPAGVPGLLAAIGAVGRAKHSSGYYTLPEPHPDFHVTAITHRKDAVYPATIVGLPPMEDFYIGGASVKFFLPIFKMSFPEFVDLAHSLAAIYKSFPARCPCW